MARCENQSTDAIEATLNLTSENSSEDIIPISAEGSATDYNGAPISFTISGEYNTTTNVMRGSILMSFPDSPSDTREDGFEVKLLKDDTGYFLATKIIANSGCNVEFRLINNGCEDTGGRIRLVNGDSKGLRGH
jgi:hypothetical protein